MAATTVNTPGTLSLSADNLILGTQTTQHSEQTTSQGRDLAYQKNRDKGQSDQTTNYNQFNVGTLAVNANHVQAGLGARDSIDALAKQPGMGWVEQITSDPKLNGKINWQRVEEEHKKWDYDQQGLTPEGAAIVTIVVAYFTAGAASEIGAAAGGAAGDAAALAAGQGAVIEGAVFAGGSSIGAGVGTFVSGAVTAGLTTLATQASIALINNQGDIGGALHDLGSSANVHSLLTAVITGGVLAGLNMNPVGLPTSGAGGQQLMTQLQQNLTAGAARAVIGTAINGGSFEDNLREGLKGAILDTIAAQSANWIGQNGPQGDASLNAFTAEVAHAIAGCAVGAARGGGTAGDGCAAGALGAVVGHLSAQFIDPNAVGGNQTVQFANMMSGIAAAITGQDANSINIAAGAGANAAANNWLQPKEAELRRQAAQACGSNPAANAKACGIVEALNQLDAAREAGNNGTLYKGVTSGLIALLMSPVTVPVELINSISENGGSETAIAILKGVALLPTNIALGLQSDNPEVQGRALVDALATTAGVTALTRAGFTIGRGTGTVWDSIKATQDVWPGTSVPRSFELQAGGGGVWVAGNGTKHIAEYAAQLSNAGASPLTIGMATQAELLSLKAAVETVISNGGITYGGRAIVVGGWELRFAPPRPGAKLPALIHALPTNAL